MRCLSLWQPWASLVATGAKRIETRSWSTAYRGLLAIHAAKNLEPAASRPRLASEPLRSALLRGGLGPGSVLPRGAVLAVARLVDVVPTEIARADAVAWGELHFGDFTPGRYAWYLDQVRVLSTPIPCRGALGLWSPPPDVLDKIREALG